MIELHPSESTRSAGPMVSHLLGRDLYVASRSRIVATDGVSLHYRAWRPAHLPVSAALVFAHGIASHSAWFAQTARYLAGQGIAVYAPDRRGSGLSGGTRGHADHDPPRPAAVCRGSHEAQRSYRLRSVEAKGP